MSVVASVAKATGAEVLRAAGPAIEWVLPTTKKVLVAAAALLTLVAFAALISASQAPNAEHYNFAASRDSQLVAAGERASEAAAAPQMSKEEALDAYGKLPLSFIPNEGQTHVAVRYYAQGAGYGFFFTHKGAMLSFAEGKGRGHALALDSLGASPEVTRRRSLWPPPFILRLEAATAESSHR